MIQAVRAPDKFNSQLFQWDVDRQILSLPHGKEIWYMKLGSDKKFTVVESKPKAQAKSRSD